MDVGIYANILMIHKLVIRESVDLYHVKVNLGSQIFLSVEQSLILTYCY